jgi:hypothetical protein
LFFLKDDPRLNNSLHHCVLHLLLFTCFVFCVVPHRVPLLLYHCLGVTVGDSMAIATSVFHWQMNTCMTTAMKLFMCCRKGGERLCGFWRVGWPNRRMTTHE